MRQAPTFSLPPVPEPVRRGSFPLAAAAVPIAGALVMWLVTASPFALWFAVLGPAIAIATMLDGRRAARRASRRHRRERGRLIDEIARGVDAAHADERAAADARHPNVAGFMSAPREIWRRVPGRRGFVVVGRGDVPSAVRVDGDGAGAGELAQRAAVVTDAPVAVPFDAGIAVVGPPPFSHAVVRGLALQVLCQHPPGEVGLAAPAPAWAEACEVEGETTLRLQPPFAAGDAVITAVAVGAPPPACAAVLTLVSPDRGLLDHDGFVREVRVEAVSDSQARAVMAHLRRRGADLAEGGRLPAEIWRDSLPAPRGGGLSVAIGAAPGGAHEIDLVADGPHAVVAGVTGAGKSELLVTWVAAMAAAHPPERVTFLLVDFKGGTAFRRLAALPHVTGILTDLDERATRRAIESLRAEIRRREAELAAAGAVDIDHPAASLSRLVVVVDEFAALLQQAPELATVFTDVAARGRGLGIHLILGTQRATGVVREAILANCPLRIALRLTDAADSHYLLGTDLAATVSERGIAHVRAASGRLAALRIARTADQDIQAIGDAAAARRSHAVWLPPLPARLSVADAPAAAAGIVLGLADEPEAQRQRAAVLAPHDAGLAIIGGPGSGRTALLAGIAEQDRHAVRVPREPEAAWDLIADLVDDPPSPGTLLLCDDVDLLLSRLPADYASAVIDRLVELVRGHGVRLVVVCGRPTGPHGRVVELCARRAQLRMPSRLDHVGAGFDAATYDPAAPRGRGTLEGTPVQFVEGARMAEPAVSALTHWLPHPGLGLVVVPGAAAARRVRAALGDTGREVSEPDTVAPQSPHDARVLVGDTDAWQRCWGQFTVLRRDAELVVAAECAADYRLLTGDRALPPYCEPGRGRAWLLAEGRAPRRILLPGAPDRRLRAVG